MLRRHHLIFSCAAMAVLPLTSNAAVVTFQFDLNDILVCATQNGTYLAPLAYPNSQLTGTSANATLQVSSGTDVEYGLDAFITGATERGIAAFQTGMINSSQSATSTAAVVPDHTPS